MGIVNPLITMSIVLAKGEAQPEISFDISSYNINFSNTTTGGGGGGGGGFRVEAGDLFVQKELDIASIPLFEAVTEGIHFRSLTLTVSKFDITILTIILKDVSVTGFNQIGSGAEVSEDVRFHYEVITLETDAFGLVQSVTYGKN